MCIRFITGLLTGVVVSIILFAAPVIAAKRPAKATQSGRLARVFVPDMLSADLPYLEHIIGPAWRTAGNTKVYKVDGCEVTATVDNGRVHALGLELSPKCTFDLSKFIAGKFPPLHTMTFGQFEALADDGRSWFMASCLALCGNAADPVVYEHWEGPHTQRFLNVILEVDLGGGSRYLAERDGSKRRSRLGGGAQVQLPRQ
jgi:hypothetical protein